MKRDVRAKVERFLQDGCEERIVDDAKRAGFMRKCCGERDVGQLQRWISRSFYEQEFCRPEEGVAQNVFIRSVDELGVDGERREYLLEESHRAAVTHPRDNHPVAGF